MECNLEVLSRGKPLTLGVCLRWRSSRLLNDGIDTSVYNVKNY